jgi:hypothetical protein
MRRQGRLCFVCEESEFEAAWNGGSLAYALVAGEPAPAQAVELNALAPYSFMKCYNL